MASGRVPPCQDYGDVLNDGLVGQDDALAIGQFVSNARNLTPEQIRRGNVTGSGKLSIVDAMRISQYVNGIIDTFEVCQSGPPVIQPVPPTTTPPPPPPKEPSAIINSLELDNTTIERGQPVTGIINWQTDGEAPFGIAGTVRLVNAAGKDVGVESNWVAVAQPLNIQHGNTLLISNTLVPPGMHSIRVEVFSLAGMKLASRLFQNVLTVMEPLAEPTPVSWWPTITIGGLWAVILIGVFRRGKQD